MDRSATQDQRQRQPISEWQKPLGTAALAVFFWLLSRNDWLADEAFSFRWRQESPHLIEYLVLSAIVVYLMLAAKAYSRVQIVLAEQEAWLALAAQAADCAFWSWDVEANLIHSKGVGRTMYGFLADKPMDYQDFLMAIHPDDRQSVQQTMRSALRQQTDYRYEHRFIGLDGAIRWVAIQGRGSSSTSGTSNLMGISIDITARKQAEQAAQEQQQALLHTARVATLGELSGALAHELNQPLAAILSNAQAGRRFLRQTPPNWEELQAILDDIVEDDRRAGEIVYRLRGLFKKQPLVRETLDINRLIQDTAQMLYSELLAKRVSLKLRLAENLPAIPGDPVQIRQVLLNLLMNGAEAMAALAVDARRLRVSTMMAETGVLQVVVQDNGPGIAPPRLEQIFRPFVTSKPEGLGMGLAISRTIIADHGGRLWAENAPDSGAVLCFTLPAIQEETP